MTNKNTSFSLFLVERYEIMLCNFYGTSFLQSLRYFFWIHIKTILLTWIFFMPLKILSGIAFVVFHQFLMFYQPTTLKIGIFGVFVILCLGYILLVSWWIHCKVSRMQGVLSVLYESAILCPQLLLFSFFPIGVSSWVAISISPITGRFLSIVLGMLCWGFMVYSCFLWYRPMFINSTSGIVEIPPVLKDKLRQELEDTRDKALGTSWLHCLFCVVLSTLKFIFFVLLYVAGILIIILFSILISNIYGILILLSTIVLSFLIPFWIHHRYTGGMWAFLHKWGCVKMVSYFYPYTIFKYIMEIFCLYFEKDKTYFYFHSIDHLSFYFYSIDYLSLIYIGLPILLFYGVFKFYRKIFGIKPISN